MLGRCHVLGSTGSGLASGSPAPHRRKAQVGSVITSTNPRTLRHLCRVLATPTVGFLFGTYLYISVNW